MIGAVLAFLSFGAAFIGAFQKAAAADMKVKELLADLESAIDGLNQQIIAVEHSRDRELTQADDALKVERDRILAEDADVVADLEEDIRQREEQHLLSAEEAETQRANLEANKKAALERNALDLEQAAAKRELTIENLAERIAAGDVEAEREVGQITAKRDEFLAQTKDEAILTLNRAGEQVEYKTGRVRVETALEIGEANARIAGSYVRKSGSPLLAIRQVEEEAKAARREEEQQAAYGIQASAMGFGQKVVSARTEAEQSVEDVMAQNALQDMELDQARERAEQDWAHTYANLTASAADIEREAVQSAAAIEAKLKAEDLDYQQDIEDLKNAAADERRRLQAELDAKILATTQAKEDIQQEADILTAEYRRNLTDVERHRKDLVTNRFSIVAAAAFGATSGVLSSTESLLASLPATSSTSAMGGGGGGLQLSAG
ncbi:MAG: hypothetical protein WC683_07910 [bacterium]